MEYVHVGLVLLCIGLWLIYKKRKRVFDRTNEYGVERFPSYGRKLLSRGKDLIIDSVGVASLSVGFLLIAFQYQDSWGGVVLLPFYLYMLYLFFPS